MKHTALALLAVMVVTCSWYGWNFFATQNLQGLPHVAAVHSGASAPSEPPGTNVSEMLSPPTRKSKLTPSLSTPIPRQVAPAAELTSATQAVDSSPADPEPSLARYRRVNSELLEHIRAQWTKPAFAAWLTEAHPLSNDRDPLSLLRADAELIHDCVTSAMAGALMSHVTEFRNVEQRLNRLREKPEASPGSRNSREARILLEDSVLSALYARCDRLNEDLASGAITLYILRVGSGNLPDGPVVCMVNHDQSLERSTCVLQRGPWEVVIRIPDSYWPQPDRVRVLNAVQRASK